jgi:DoxX-like family
MSHVFPVFGAAVAVSGSDKLSGITGYRAMSEHLGWSQDAMQAFAAAELAGGLLMIPRTTRGVGGALLLAAFAAVLGSEWRRGDLKLALPRGLVLAVAAAAMLTPGRRKAWRKAPTAD